MPHSGELWAMVSQTPAAPLAVSPTGSPMTWIAPSAGSLAVAGGTVSLIEVGRAGLFVLAGLVGGMIPVSAGDSVRLTYVVAPTIKFLPR